MRRLVGATSKRRENVALKPLPIQWGSVSSWGLPPWMESPSCPVSRKGRLGVVPNQHRIALVRDRRILSVATNMAP